MHINKELERELNKVGCVVWENIEDFSLPRDVKEGLTLYHSVLLRYYSMPSDAAFWDAVMRILGIDDINKVLLDAHAFEDGKNVTSWVVIKPEAVKAV